jgi:hypothetical protein
MSEEILINFTPQETRVASRTRASCRNCISSAAPAAASSATSTSAHRPHAARHAVGLHRHRPRARRLPARGRHPEPPLERRTPAADRAHPAFRGPEHARAGDQGPDRHQGRAPVHPGVDRRAHARLPAAGQTHRHLAAHRATRPSASAARALQRLVPATKKAASSCARWPRMRHRAELPSRHRVPAQALARPPGAVDDCRAADPALPGPLSGAARAARHRQPTRPPASSSTRARTSRS